MLKISEKDLRKMEKEYSKDKKSTIIRRALYKNDITSISSIMEEEANTNNVFSIDLKTLEVTNQYKSGRCWIFSACNVLREKISKKYNLDNFELSQNYLAFYDKLEKINFFLEIVLNEKDTDLSEETLRYILEKGVEDGGQWNMISSLVKKYGIVPKHVMPDSFQGSNTHSMNYLINMRIRKFAAESKRLNKKEALNEKENVLKECYGFLCNCYGIPPKKFDFEYRDKDNNFYSYRDITPIEFYRDFLDYDLDDYVAIINGPTKDKPYYNMYTVKYLGNVIDGDPISYLNLPMDEFKDLVIKQLKDNEVVWFGSDVAFFGDRTKGVWDDLAYDYKNSLSFDIEMSKEDMLDTRHSAMNHAMVITGVNLVDDKPNRFKIENSWGDSIGNKGYFICSDSWFDKFVYQAVINKKYLSKKQLNCLDKEPIELKPWDPFGTLA